MNIYGYCRISTAKQSIDRQIRNIKAEYPTAHIVQEAYTGTSIFRPEWLKLYRILKAGDVHLVIKHYFQATENPHGVIIHVGIFRITIQQLSYELPAQYILVLLSLEFSILFQFASL